MKRRRPRTRVPKKTPQTRRKRSSSASRYFLPAALRPACRHHISLKLLPLVQLPGAGVANVSVCANLWEAAGLRGNRRRWSLRPGAYEDDQAALTLEHVQCMRHFLFQITRERRPHEASPEVTAGSRSPQVCSSVFALLPSLTLIHPLLKKDLNFFVRS